MSSAPRTVVARTRAAFSSTANRAVLRTAFSMVGTTAITSLLGFAFWTVAARSFLPAEVGIAATAVSAMTLLANIGMVGLGTMLIAELPRQPGREPALIASAAVAAGIVAFALGSLAGAAAGVFVADLQMLATSLPLNLLFSLGVAVTAMTLVLDQAFLGLLLGSVQVWRNTIFSLAKLLFVPLAGSLLPGANGMTIYALWLAGNLVSVGYVAAVLVRRFPSARLLAWPSLGWVWRSRSGAFDHNTLNLSLQLWYYLLPLVATALISAEAAAYFYIAIMIANFVSMPPFALTMGIFAVGARTPQLIGQRTRFTIPLAAALGGAANLVLLVAAEPLLTLFGPGYADGALPSLRILALGVFPLIVKDHYVAICRVEGRVREAARVMVIGGAGEIALAALGALLAGLPGVALGWLSAVTLEAIFTAPIVLRAVTQARSAPQPTA
ncbi:MAG: MATE family efflux transporter [Chloroflexota bacterium]|nr:MATE family efflux transporter [Dehalococcoidia bacterium]MDW8252952.1 MATE family efflux transporter [Chloroflexota bacterium]